jgi:hypothetical protein
MSFILETFIVGGVGATLISAIPYLSYVGYVYKFKVINIFKYKHAKKKIYKGINKAIDEQDIQALRDWFSLLARFDSKYDRTKTVTLKKKLGICDELLSDRKLFKLKFDSRYLVENYKNINVGSHDLDIREQDILERERKLDNFSDFDKVKRKEYDLMIKEKELTNREKEIQEIISNLNML